MHRSAPHPPLRKILCPCFPFPLISTNPGTIWTQKKNTRPGLVPALPGLTDCLRNHKGGLLHRGRARYVLVQMKLLGNRCPFCRDHEPHVDLRNVKLWGRFVRARSGVPFLAPDTGVCAKQREKLTQAVQKAGDRGLPSYRIPQVEPRDPDLGNSHGAVSATPPGPHSGFR